MLVPIDPQIEIKKYWDKLEVISQFTSREDCNKISNVLSHTPGIANFMLVKDYPLENLHDIYEKAKSAYENTLAGKTFVVRCRRNGNHDFTSLDVERYVGGGLNQHTEALRVQLKDPDVTVLIEIRGDRYFIIEKVFPGLGGFPLGSQEAVISLISGGFDSAVASYLTMRRGLRTHFCFFNLGGRAHEIAVKQVAYFLWSKYGASHRVKFIAIPFEEVVAEILQNVENSQMGVILKRMFLRAAAEMAEQLSVQALVTGESVAQVSSQTLPNLSVIDSVTDTLVLRPLITSDKQDIINLAIEIGTEEFSKNIPEYCGVISVKPTTRAKRDKIVREEEHFDFSVLQRAIERAVMTNIDELAADLGSPTDELDIRSELDTMAVIIDIRHPTEEELNPLKHNSNEIVRIPFYELAARFTVLTTTKHYYLYCEKGVMSQLQAVNLIDAGFKNVGVYRP